MNLRPLVICIIFGLLLGCQSKQGSEPAAESASAPMQQAAALDEQAKPDSKPAAETLPLADRKIIRNATLRFRVDKLTESEAHITKLATQFGGMISSSQENRSGGLFEIALTVRVPSARLDEFLAVLLKESIYTDTKTISTEDVTRQYADTDARIRAKKVTEARYLQLLQKARNVEEVMAVEAQLGQMREDIEAQEAVLRTLKNDVALSTVTLTMYERGEYVNEPDVPFYVKAAQNFRDGFTFLGQFIVGAFYFVPLLLIVAALWWAIRWWRRR